MSAPGADPTAADTPVADTSVGAALPGWLRTLAARSGSVTTSELSRFGPPADGSGRQSAVLIALAQRDGQPAVLLLERAAEMRKHAGQIAFPGGSLDPDDDGPQDAALREAAEEVALDPHSVQVIATLPAVYIPVTRFVVTPVIAWWREPHEVRAVDAAEVARVALIRLGELADPHNRFQVEHPSGWIGPAFEVDGLFIWGFTAGLLDRVLTFGGWARPWDRSLRRPLPPALAGR